jgi:YHS domain-containing protein
VYLCCQGCTGKVRENPERYVTNATPVRHQPAQEAIGRELTVAKATAADEATIQAQGACPVMNTRLGSMGTPIKVTRGGRSLFLCCQGCVSKVEKNPDYYFAQATRMRTGG